MKSPIQSVEVGDAIPLHAAVTEPPALTVVGLSVRTTPPATAVTVKGGLVARRVKPLAENSRTHPPAGWPSAFAGAAPAKPKYALSAMPPPTAEYPFQKATP